MSPLLRPTRVLLSTLVVEVLCSADRVRGTAAPPHYYETQTYTPSFCQTGAEVWPARTCWEVTGGILGFLLLILISLPISMLISHRLTHRRLEVAYNTTIPHQRALARDLFRRAVEEPEKLTGPQRLAVQGKRAWSETGSIRAGVDDGWGPMEEGGKGLWVEQGDKGERDGMDGIRYPTPPPAFQVTGNGFPSAAGIEQTGYPPPPQARDFRFGSTIPGTGSTMGGANPNAFTRTQERTCDPHGGPMRSAASPHSSPHPFSHSRVPTYETLPRTVASSVMNFSFDHRPLSGDSSVSSPSSSLGSPINLPILQTPAPVVPRRHPDRRPASGSTTTYSDLFQFPVPPTTGPTSLMAQPLGQALGYHLPARMMARRALSIDTTVGGGGVGPPAGNTNALRAQGGNTRHTGQISASLGGTFGPRPVNGRSASDGSPTLVRVPTAALMRSVQSECHDGNEPWSAVGARAHPLMNSLERSDASIFASAASTPSPPRQAMSGQAPSSTTWSPRSSRQSSDSSPSVPSVRSSTGRTIQGRPTASHRGELNKLHKPSSSGSLATPARGFPVSPLQTRSPRGSSNKVPDRADLVQGMSVGPAWHQGRMRAMSGSTGSDSRA